jgi:hypothetical protein
VGSYEPLVVDWRSGPRAREAELFVANATASAERTWQALAWETHAEVALATDDLVGKELHWPARSPRSKLRHPWRPGRLTRRLPTLPERGDTLAATHHRQASRDIILALASSLGRTRSCAGFPRRTGRRIRLRKSRHSTFAIADALP